MEEGRGRGGGWSRLLKNNKAITSNPQMYFFTPTHTAVETAAGRPGPLMSERSPVLIVGEEMEDSNQCLNYWTFLTWHAHPPLIKHYQVNEIE